MITITTQTGQLISDTDLARAELEQSINDARQYLNQTDWKLARQVETGEPVDAETLAKRAEARALIRANTI